MLPYCDTTGDWQPSIESDEHANALKGLADALMKDHAVSHKLDSIEKAVSIYEEVLQLRPSNHTQHAAAIIDLGDALFLFCVSHERNDTRAQRCLGLHREAVQSCPPGHPLRDRALHTMARALVGIGFDQQSGGLSALSECIVLNREALHLRKVGHPERDQTLNNLALALMRSFEQCGDPILIVECISMNREAVTLRKPGHPRRDISLSNLGTALLRFSFFHGRLDVLAESESFLRMALELRPPGHPLRLAALGNLALSLRTRYDLQALPSALSAAIALLREGWDLLPAGHPERWRYMDNLADCLVADFRHRHDSSSIIEAITILRQALLLRPVGDRNRHHALSTLAEALLAQFDECKEPMHLREAITLHREALDLRSHGHTQRLETLHKLGHLLTKPDCQSWTEALALFCEALELCPEGHPSRSSLLSDMSKCFLDPASPYFDLQKGILHLSEGYSNELSHVNQRLGQAVLDLRQVEAAYTESMRCASTLTKDHYSGLILDLHAQVIGLLPRAANFGLDHKTRLQVIVGSDEIARNAAARALQLGRITQAVELLEEGRGTFWSQTLHLRATGFDGVPDVDCEDLLRLLRMLEHGARTAESSEQSVAQREETLERRRLLNEEAEALVSRIRAYPGCTRFLLPAAFESLFNGLPNGFIVILNASKLGYHALLLHKATKLVTSLELELSSTSFDWAVLRTQLLRDMDPRPEQQNEPYTRAMRLDSGRNSSFEDILFQQWSCIVQPVIRKLGLQTAVGHNRPRLWWCVTGELGFLPIHAAGSYRGANPMCTADYVVSSYIPTLSSLTKSRSGWEPLPRSSVTGLLVCETYADHGSARHLPGADQEVCLVRGCFESAHASVLNVHSPHMSLAGFRALLQGIPAHVLHLACHGVQDADPLNSALIMGDGKLTIEDMLHLDLPRAVLAYLSACQTAKGDKNAPDQVVHLAASMLFCGFRSVVGTMWLMHDEDGPKLAQRFYEALFVKETLDLDDIAYALDDAVQSLRRQGVPAERWALFMHMGG